MIQDSEIEYIVKNASEIYRNVVFPDGPVCPDCGCHEVYECSDGRYICKHCHKKFSLRSSTLCENSNLPISKWMIALYLVLSGRGISSIQLAKRISVTQKTAWRMLMRLRLLFSQEDTVLFGEVAFDETFFGGTFSRMSLKKRQFLLSKFMLPQHTVVPSEKMSIGHRVNALYKSPIMGMNDGEKIVLQVMPNPMLKSDEVAIFNKHTLESGMAVSDNSYSYDHWKELTGYELHQNDHSKMQFVADNGSSSNRIEGEFSIMKRDFLHNYGHTSKKFLQLYLDEHCYRFNSRGEEIFSRIKNCMKKWKMKVKKEFLIEYDALKEFPERKQEIFDPYKFFKTLGCIVNEYEYKGIVYRRSEFT